jgi:hypothetical protein
MYSPDNGQTVVEAGSLRSVPPVYPPREQLAPSQSSSNIHRHISEASSISTNVSAEISQDVNVSCVFCGRQFHARKALNRHVDDFHSAPIQCSRTCNFWCVGRRKMQYHLKKTHGEAVPLHDIL